GLYFQGQTGNAGLASGWSPDVSAANPASFAPTVGMEGDTLRLVVTFTETAASPQGQSFTTTDTATTNAVTVQELTNDLTASIIKIGRASCRKRVATSADDGARTTNTNT